jgi:hypothetical protein
MSQQRSEQLTALAQQILRDNDRGGYTIPTNGLYPFQWCWDSSVTALGWMTFDEPRAWEELLWLVKGQWRRGSQHGLIAHIAFHQPSDSYFPGPSEWGCLIEPGVRAVATSSISQPPLHASMVRLMFESAHDPALATRQIARLMPSLCAHHRWWYLTRDPDCTGLVASLHPWETGMDNSPAWDESLDAVPRTGRAYTRKDIVHVDHNMRPKQPDYDRFVSLMDRNKALQFDARAMWEGAWWRMQDVGTNFILHRATRDLLWLIQTLPGLQPWYDQIAPLKQRLQMAQNAFAKLWLPSSQQFVSRDDITAQLVPVPTHAGMLAWWALHGTTDKLLGNLLEQQAKTLSTWLQEAPYCLSSIPSSVAQFDAQRYWRGPIWQHMNFMIAHGLDADGYEELALQIRASSFQLFNESEFHEYYHPITGAGLGGERFSWTAASYLWMLHG